MKFGSRQATVAAAFASLAYLTRFFNIVIPIGGPFVLDMRGVFVAVGASVGGPWVGLIVGLISGVPAQIPLIDIPSFGLAGLTTGFLAQRFFRRSFVSLSALGMLVGYVVAAVVIFLFIPAIIVSVPVLMLRATIMIPLEFIALLTLYRIYPRAFEIHNSAA